MKFYVILETAMGGELDRIEVKGNPRSEKVTEGLLREAIMRLTTCPRAGDIIRIVEA